MKMTSKKLTVGSGGLNARWIQSFCTAAEHTIGCGNDGRLLHNKGCTQ
jgi:hypothetical protein